MRKTIIIAAITLAAAATNAQAGEDGAAWCQSFTEASGISDEPCACVVEAAETDPALAEELYSYATRDEYVAEGSAELKELLKPCVSDAP